MNTSRWLVVGACAAISATTIHEGIAQVSSPPSRTIISVAPADHFSVPFPTRTAMDLSSDGRVLVFTALGDTRQRLYRRVLDNAEATPIAGTDGAASPFLSPDGKTVAFFSNGELKKVSLDGGTVSTICKVRGILGASWGADNTIVSGQGLGPLWQVPASGGVPSALTSLDTARGETGHRLPQILPGGDAVLFTVTYNWLPRWKDTQIAVYSRRTGARKVLIEGGADGRYVPSGHLVYAREGVFLAAPFDLERLEVTGPSIAVGDVLQQNYGTDLGSAQFRVSQSGTLVYIAPAVRQEEERSLVWVDRTGREEPLPIPARKYFGPRVSPEGRRVVFYEMERDVDVWLFDTRNNALTRVTTEGRNGQPFWSPDGTRLVYRSAITGPDNIFWRAANRTDVPERLATSLRNQVATAFTPDGKALIVQEVSADLVGGDVSVILVPLNGKGSPRHLMDGASGPEPSPDGHWLAYHSNKTGRDEVYVQPYPGPGPAVQISTEGGMMPLWRRDGKELFYWLPGGSRTGRRRTLMAASIAMQPSFRAGTPKPLLDGPYYVSAPGRSYDVAPEGQRFILVRADDRVEQPPLTDMIVVQNWFEELKRRMLVKRSATQQ